MEQKGHKEPTTRAGGLTDVWEARHRIWEEHHPEPRDHCVIATRREVITRCIADNPLDLGSRDALSGSGDHGRRDVDTGHRAVGADRLPGLPGGRSRADTDIEHALAR